MINSSASQNIFHFFGNHFLNFKGKGGGVHEILLTENLSEISGSLQSHSYISVFF